MEATAAQCARVRAACAATGRSLVLSAAQTTVVGRHADAGATRLYLQLLDLSDLDHLELIAAEVTPSL